MEYITGHIARNDVDLTGAIELGLKTTSAAGNHDAWGGAFSVRDGHRLAQGKYTLKLRDGRVGRIVIDSIRADDGDPGTSIATFLGVGELVAPGAIRCPEESDKRVQQCE